MGFQWEPMVGSIFGHRFLKALFSEDVPYEESRSKGTDCCRLLD